MRPDSRKAQGSLSARILAQRSHHDRSTRPPRCANRARRGCPRQGHARRRKLVRQRPRRLPFRTWFGLWLGEQLVDAPAHPVRWINPHAVIAIFAAQDETRRLRRARGLLGHHLGNAPKFPTTVEDHSRTDESCRPSTRRRGCHIPSNDHIKVALQASCGTPPTPTTAASTSPRR